MNSPEVFYLNSNGEQRGPYTIQHIDHLLNSGIISEDALFWREGMEQWQPVTELVPLRIKKKKKKKEKRWIPTSGLIAIGVVLLVLARIFGPIALDGWREAAQTDFTEEAAYWRARDFARHSVAPIGVVQFFSQKSAEITLHPPNAATAVVKGRLIPNQGGTRETAWRVEMNYNPIRKEWTSAGVQEIAP